MPLRTRLGTRRRWLPAGLMAAALAAGPLAPAAAAPVVMVRCPDDNLQTAITAAAPGSMLLVSGTCTGPFRITRPLTLMGIGLDPTLDGRNAGTVVTVSPGVQAELNGLTITRGKAAAGGGVNNTGRLTLFRSTVTGNGSTEGGGIYNGTGGTTTLNLSEVNGNTAIRGAGIYNKATLTLTGSTVNVNRSNGEGGGIFNDTPGRATLTRSTVSGNTAALGGGIFNRGSVRLTLTQVVDNVPDNCFPRGSVPGCTG
ncbi:hypothetical protein ACWDFL_22615 [Streptomyces bungoensis]